MAKAGHKTDIMPLLIDSEAREGLQYEIKDGHIILRGGPNGLFCMSLGAGEDVGMEIASVCNVWKDART